MSLWIEIKHAPKDRPIDVWVVHSRGAERIPDVRWEKDFYNHSGHPHWCVYSDDAGWQAVIDFFGGSAQPTHYMEIPKGPNI